MLNVVVTVTKLGVIVFWLAFALSLASVIPTPYGAIIIGLAAFVLLVHLAEYLFIRFGVIKLDLEEVSFARTMLFGFTYWAPLLKRQ